MTDARWSSVRAVFEQVMELRAEERAATLDRLCAHDPGLRSEIELMLRHHDVAGGFLDPLAGGSVPDRFDVPLAGTRVNGYVIEREIATGGMGVVYEARQESPERRVALKMMRLDLSAPATRRRFEYESQLLGRLRHPGIAQIYQAGTYRTAVAGREVELPFFAMEYVEGARTLLAHAEAEKLGVEDRVRLFVRVCDAVHHGHQKGVIHRDLKPGNILVGSDGRPKVIDFGIARATDPDVAMTRTVDRIIGTLQYMSPEQLAGDPAAIDVRTDVYGLGLVLYELLTGRLPFDVSDKPIPELARVVREQPPPRPGAISASVPAELDWVVLRALEKDPERRYRSASELAADLGRFLENEPVLAGPPSATYRLRKFVRRNRGAVAAVIAVVASLAIGLVVSLAQYRQAREEERIARATNEFLDRWLSSADPDLHGRDVKILDLLADAAREIEGAFQEEPLVRASLRLTIGRALQALGEYRRAEAELRKAHATRRSHLGPEHPHTLEAAYHLDLSLQRLFRLAEAEELLRSTQEASTRRLGPDHRLTLACGASLGVLLKERGRYAEAEMCLRHALAGQRAVLGPRNEETLSSLTGLAELLRIEGNLDDAEAFAREALAGLVEIRGEVHSRTLHARNILAVVLNDRGKFTEAEALQRQTLGAFEEQLGPQHPATLTARRNLADLLRYHEMYEEAERLFRGVLEVQRTKLGEDHPDTIITLNDLGVTLDESGQHAAAEAVYRRALPLAARVFGDGDIRYAETMGGLALALKRQGKLDEAETLYERALALRRAIFTEEHPDVLIAMNNLAALLKVRGKLEASRELYEKTLRLRAKVLGEDHPRTLTTRHNLIGVLRGLGQLEEAERLARMNAELMRRVRGPDSLYTHHAYYRPGLVLQRADKWQESLSVFGNLLAEDLEHRGSGDPFTEQTRFQYARCLGRLDRHRDAEAPLLTGCRALAERFGDRHDLTRKFLEALATLYGTLDRPDEAEVYRARLAPASRKDRRP